MRRAVLDGIDVRIKEGEGTVGEQIYESADWNTDVFFLTALTVWHEEDEAELT